MWWRKDCTINKAICILAFQICHHLPLPCKVVVTGELGSDTVGLLNREAGDNWMAEEVGAVGAAVVEFDGEEAMEIGSKKKKTWVLEML